MKRRTIFTTITVVIVLIIAIISGTYFYQKQQANQVQDIQPVKAVSKTTPTFFFHGWGSSYHAEEKMVQAIKHADVTKSVIRVNVKRNGKAVMHSTLNSHARNPIVEVNFDDNKLSGARSYVKAYQNRGAIYVRNAINAVVNRYHYQHINIVAHSMGNLEDAYYIKRFIRTNSRIKLDHLVAIAGHYDGIVGMDDEPNRLKLDSKSGKPNRMVPEYRGLLSLRRTFPRNTRVLNIFGNLENGTNSDGDVSVNSARSLRYLLNGRAKSYHELMIKGKNAQHSHLHNNRQVNQALVKFLWQK